jgi:hypothetical protein
MMQITIMIVLVLVDIFRLRYLERLRAHQLLEMRPDPANRGMLLLSLHRHLNLAPREKGL